ncbi:hypothetical protein ACFL0U_01940 [Pseudomonadota bacterium]
MTETTHIKKNKEFLITQQKTAKKHYIETYIYRFSMVIYVGYLIHLLMNMNTTIINNQHHIGNRITKVEQRLNLNEQNN